MRLLNTSTLQVQVMSNTSPTYAILSHTWGRQEVTFQDIHSPVVKEMEGFSKIHNACEVARSEGFEYIWIDSCCIDKTSSAELSEAINSMYHWYKEAQVCYAYLSDVEPDETDSNLESAFRESRWFKRGWTLQELIAPSSVIFFNCNWVEIGSKSSLSRIISERTGISPAVLLGYESDSTCIADKMCWAAGRETTRVEDLAYSLMGLFGVNMAILYGERESAFIRLQHEIIKKSDDHTIFAWISGESGPSVGGLFASSPKEFDYFAYVYGAPKQVPDKQKFRWPFYVTNIGLRIEVPLIPETVSNPPHETGAFSAVLNCEIVRRHDVRPSRLAMVLHESSDGHFVRNNIFNFITSTSLEGLHARTLIIKDQPQQPDFLNFSTDGWFLIEPPHWIGDFYLRNGYPLEVIRKGAESGRCYVGGHQRTTQGFEFRNPVGEKFIIAVGVGSGSAWCDVVTDTGDQTLEAVVNSHDARTTRAEKLNSFKLSDRVKKIVAGSKTIGVTIRRGPGSVKESRKWEVYSLQAKMM